MAPSAIQQSLAVLIPTYSQKLPPQLTHLAESLLAQSRQRASHLKPEEEIARAYACCEIACKRLRPTCRLPAVKSSGAPCKPAVYKKLLTFLERVLDEDSAQTPKSTPNGRKRAVDGQIKPVEPTPTTPSKTGRGGTPASGGFLGRIRAASGKTTSRDGDGTGAEDEAPSWLMPSIRKLCRLCSTPLLAPHVYTGTCVVLRLAGLWPRPEDGGEDAESDQNSVSFKEDVTGLLIALYLMTLTRMKTGNMTTSVYKSTCSKSAEELEYKPAASGVEVWIRRINREGYCGQQDWWVSVPEGVFDFDPNNKDSRVARSASDDVGENEVDEEEDVILSSKRRRKTSGSGESEDEDDPEGVLLPGLHTMMQNAVDFLSEERTRDYVNWKKQFLRKLDRLDKRPAASATRATAVQ
ncbi:hypothetical protein PV05_00988 [Exophiala xenobiotica]|uniref:ORC6 first cyclin-like domain-containing protein n=1 Tax=Exophiala xenobiotica TaxID=348802 RepID=A0A0D2C799_9EURO|nr:uncharacterized protein PV05_00988 [Exophiala xenobiotica]KIW60801.1 hypothetical protein PV05_00988 [Exophiala xenobiotica]